MARNDGVDRTVARNRDLKKSAAIDGAQAHNERKKEVYSNPDIVPERTTYNVHFKEPTASYEEMFLELEKQKVISTWGLKPDSTKFCELVFDVNSAYFYNHGGYDFAKKFYADAYEAAVKIVGGEQYILSAVMHADERNRAMSEALEQDVYHYHLHVVYVPVVEKKILWTKRCKDPALVGTVKETIMQVSRSKKWESKPAMDENGQPKRTASGKKLLEKSYSVLQDDFYRYMFEAGYTDLQRGERGSTEEHLTVTQFKVEQEQKRLAELSVKKENVLDDLESLSLKKEKAEEKLTGIEERTQEAWERLHELTPAVKNAEEFVKNNVSSLEELLPEAGALDRAKGYREEKAIPLILKIKKLLLSLYRALIEMRQKYLDLQRSYDRVVRDRDYYSDRLEAAEKENGTLKAAAKDLGRVKRAFGSEQVEAAITAEQEREAAEAAAKKEARAARFRLRRDAR